MEKAEHRCHKSWLSKNPSHTHGAFNCLKTNQKVLINTFGIHVMRFSIPRKWSNEGISRAIHGVNLNTVKAGFLGHLPVFLALCPTVLCRCLVTVFLLYLEYDRVWFWLCLIWFLCSAQLVKLVLFPCLCLPCRSVFFNSIDWAYGFFVVWILPDLNSRVVGFTWTLPEWGSCSGGGGSRSWVPQSERWQPK